MPTPSMPMIHFLLLQIRSLDTTEPGLAELARDFLSTLPMAATLTRAAWSDTAKEGYVHLELAQPEPLGKEVPRTLERAFAATLPAGVSPRVSRLERMLEIPGQPSTAQAAFHYAVEMDPESGWMSELSRWYDTEHLPGLASVPGTLRAMRLLNHDHGPLSLAWYDLVDEATMGSPAWLAVRGTPWSSQMRPHFTNTKRTMMRVIA